MATVIVALILATLVIAYAWIDGGRRPLRMITASVRPQPLTIRELR